MIKVQSSNGRRRRVTKGLLLYGTVIGLIVGVMFFGWNSKEEMDASTGRTRTVNTVVGVPVWWENPKPTILTDWLSGSNGPVDWVRVRGPYPKTRRIRIHYCVDDLLRELPLIESDLSLTEMDGLNAQSGRRQLATGILTQLRAGRDICVVARHVSDFRTTVLNEFGLAKATLTLDALNETWLRSGRLLSNKANKPD